MLKYDPHFFRFLELPPLLTLIDGTVSDSAILHLQNGFVLPSFAASEQRQVFQNSYHQDFPRVLNGYLASVNAFLRSTSSPATTERRGCCPARISRSLVQDCRHATRWRLRSSARRDR